MRCPYLKIKTVKRLTAQETEIIETFGECTKECPFHFVNPNGQDGCRKIQKSYWIKKGVIMDDKNLDG